jgi:hypothetical protein
MAFSIWAIISSFLIGGQTLPFPGPGGHRTAVTDTAFITGVSAFSLRNNYGDYVGIKFTVGGTALTCTQLGRMFFTGNSGTHTVKLVLVSNSTDVSGGSVSIAMTGGTDHVFKYVALASPVTLSASTAYYLVSLESSGGDQWNDAEPVTSTSAATVNGVTFWDGFVYQNAGNAGDAFVPVSFLYH